MKKKVKKALVGAITKWDGIAQGCLKDQGGVNCPLCQLFDDCMHEINFELHVGKSCPVAVSTGMDDYLGTEYRSIKEVLQ